MIWGIDARTVIREKGRKGEREKGKCYHTKFMRGLSPMRASLALTWQ